MRILITDDNPDYAKMLSMYMERYGDVDIAENGTEAFKSFTASLREGKPFQVICLDIMMPMRDGFETVKSIKLMQEKLGMRVDFILMSGKECPRYLRRAEEMGIDQFVSKQDGLRPFFEAMCDLGHDQSGTDFDEQEAADLTSSLE